MKRWFLFLIFIFFNACLVHAVGIGPPVSQVDFEPNSVKELDFFVLNTGSGPLDVAIEARGELASIVSFSQNNIHLSEGDVQAFKVILQMPDRIETPGPNQIRIIALEAPTGEGTVGAVAGVEARLTIVVPYEGAFISAELSVPNIAAGENLPVSLAIENIGTADIADLSGSFEVLQGDGIIMSEEFEPQALAMQSKTSISKELKTSQLQAGSHTLRATIHYAGNTKIIEKKFGIGGEFIEILGLESTKFRAGEIAKLQFNVISNWNKPLEGSASIRILKGDEEIALIKSSLYSFEPWKQSTIEVFWDASSEPAGSYTAKIELVYGDNKQTAKEFEISLAKGRALAFVIGLAALVVTVMIAWWAWQQRRKDQSY